MLDERVKVLSICLFRNLFTLTLVSSVYLSITLSLSISRGREEGRVFSCDFPFVHSIASPTSSFHCLNMCQRDANDWKEKEGHMIMHPLHDRDEGTRESDLNRVE